MDKEKSYFSKNINVLDNRRIRTSIECCDAVSFEEALEKAKSKYYKAFVYLYNEIRAGYYINNTWEFIDSRQLESKYIIQARLFDENEEILIQKKDNKFLVRVINDNENGELCTVVDSVSELFGKKADDLESDKFVHLVEPGRKISLIIPACGKADKYELVTRSYITYDETTGQAGFGYYRWLGIFAKERM